jgi:hypothetical protein
MRWFSPVPHVPHDKIHTDSHRQRTVDISPLKDDSDTKNIRDAVTEKKDERPLNKKDDSDVKSHFARLSLLHRCGSVLNRVILLPFHPN